MIMTYVCSFASSVILQMPYKYFHSLEEGFFLFHFEVRTIVSLYGMKTQSVCAFDMGGRY